VPAVEIFTDIGDDEQEYHFAGKLAARLSSPKSARPTI
jgi:hypothetical protein